MLHYTKKELEALFKERLDELVNCAGGYVHLAKMLKITPSTVKGWVSRGRISKDGAKLILENNSLKEKFTPEYLRPDLEV